MTEPVGTATGRRPAPSTGAYADPRRAEPANLADILERVLDKGIVIAGDIQVNLLDIELLTVKLRLVVASVERAREMGIDWWEHDPSLSSAAAREDTRSVPEGSASQPPVSGADEQTELADENRRLRERIEALEAERQGEHPTTPSQDGDHHG